MVEEIIIIKEFVKGGWALVKFYLRRFGRQEDYEYIVKELEFKVDKFEQIIDIMDRSDSLIELNTEGFKASNITKFTGSRTQYDEECEDKRMKGVLTHTFEALKDENVPNIEMDEDWRVRFSNIAQDISNEDMQFIWGNILASKIRKPNSFSVRTLEIIKNLSTEEANKFQEFAKYTCKDNNRYYLLDSELAIKELRKDLCLFSDCGLIELDKSTLTLKRNSYVLSRDHAFKFDDSLPEYVLHVFTMKECGNQLLDIMKYESDNKYIEDNLNKQTNQKCIVMPLNKVRFI